MKKILTICILTAMLFTTVGCNKPNQEEISSGETLYAAFKQAVNDNPEATAEELANIIIKNKIIRFEPMVMPVTEGWLMGFDAETIEGFKEGAAFAPTISVIPFLGYVFILEEGADVNAFINTLKNHANLCWNICTAAEEVTAGNAGQIVFFLMCNKDINAE
ncbi:MAG: hypothetical protein ACOX1F_05635 [Erysipelotrichaceae bacterium]|jgi:hypothetical protein